MDGNIVLGPPAVAKVIFRTDIGPGFSIKLVEYVDGRFGILQNARLLDGRVWADAELELCIETYLKLCRAIAPPEALPV